MATTYHMNIDIAWLLSSDRRLRDWSECGGAPVHVVAAGLMIKQAQGHRVIPMGECNNFCPIHGCKGHERG